MDKKKLVTIVYDDGTVEEVEMIIAFEIRDTKKEYMIYTKNERDENDNVTIYVGTIEREDGSDTVQLKGIETEEEWIQIKFILKNLSKSEEQIYDEIKEQE